ANQIGCNDVQKDVCKVPANRMESKECVVDEGPGQQQGTIKIYKVGVKTIPQMHCEETRQIAERSDVRILADQKYIVINKRKCERLRVAEKCDAANNDLPVRQEL